MYASDPAGNAVAVVGSDVTDLESPTRSLYIGTTGNLTVVMYPSRNVVTFSNVPVGVLPIRVARVNLTGLTAGAIVALW